MELTIENVLTTLEEVVEATGPDHIYVNPKGQSPRDMIGGDVDCSYADPMGAPSCIVGHVLYKLDRELFEKIAAVEQDRKCSISVNHLNGFNPAWPVVGDEATRTILKVAQRDQDLGHTYGQALLRAKREAARFVQMAP